MCETSTVIGVEHVTTDTAKVGQAILSCPIFIIYMEKIIKETFMKSDGTRKVEIFQRENKTFGFEELEFGSEENSWYPVGEYSLAIIDSLDNAIREAEGRVSWLRNHSPELD